uniref:titin-like n=1 Tax=Doryrhamphus excisus TaxID=161450 RepID=UPI0025ADAD06|nr:titin-like [Doryrhamphus excisus]
MDPAIADPFGLKSLVDCIFRAIYFSQPTDMSDFIHQYITDLMDFIGCHEEEHPKSMFILFQEKWEKNLLDSKDKKTKRSAPFMDSIPSLQNISEEEIEDLLQKLYRDLALANVLPQELVHKRRKRSKRNKKIFSCCDASTETDLLSVEWISSEDDSLGFSDDSDTMLGSSQCCTPPVPVATMPNKIQCCSPPVPVETTPDLSQCDLPPVPFDTIPDLSRCNSPPVSVETLPDLSQFESPPVLVETIPDLSQCDSPTAAVPDLSQCYSPSVPVDTMPDVNQCCLPELPLDLPSSSSSTTPSDMKELISDSEATLAEVSQKLATKNDDERNVMLHKHGKETHKAGKNSLLNKQDKIPGSEKVKCMNRVALLMPDQPGVGSFGPKTVIPKNRLKPIESKNNWVSQRQKPGKPELQTPPKTQESKKLRVGPCQALVPKRPEKTEIPSRLTFLEATTVLPRITPVPRRPKVFTSSMPEVRRTRLSLRRLYGPDKPKIPTPDNRPPKLPWRSPLSDPPRREGPARVLWMDRERVKPVQTKPTWSIPATVLF